MTKLEAIAKIARAEGVEDASKVVGIKQVLGGSEESAETTAKVFSSMFTAGMARIMCEHDTKK